MTGKAKAPVPADAKASEALPAVLRPGTHVVPIEGRVEVSTAAFATEVLRLVPPSALLFRMGDVVGVLAGPAGARRFLILTADDARLFVDRAVRITASKKNEDSGDIDVAYSPCGRDLAGLVLAEAKSSALVRPLASLVGHPVYLPGWSLAAAGYNAPSGVFYDEPDALRGIVPAPNGAREVLEDAVAGFRFKGMASVDHAFAYLLTLAMRPAIEGNRPLFLIRANREGTGKTTLGRTLGVAVTGTEPAPMQFGSTEEEREKRLTSLLLSGATTAMIDNLPAGQEVDSSALAQLATAPSWTGRRLGKSETPSVPNPLTLLLTGNNVSASAEIARRVVPIHLEAESATPFTETGFPHEDATAYALKRRPEILAALLGMVEAWKAAGRPPCRSVVVGGFDAWARSVGGVLLHAGAEAFGGNLAEWWNTADEFGADAAALYADWHREALAPAGARYSDPVAAKAIYQRAEKVGLFPEFRQAPTETGRAVAFSRRVLSVLTDRRVEVQTGTEGTVEKRVMVLRRLASGSSSYYRLEVCS